MALRIASILLILWSQSGRSQDFTEVEWTDLLAFGNHLHKNQLHAEQDLFCNKLLNQTLQTTSQFDTIHFIKARALFYLDQQNASVYELEKISNGGLIPKSQLLISYNKFLTNDLEKDHLTHEVEDNSVNDQLAISHNLMSRNFEFVDSISSISNNSSKLTPYLEIGSAWRNHKQKSALVAGLLSSTVPGLGKWYAGNFNQAAGSFLSVAFSGIQAIEGYRSGGLKNGRFIAFGILTSVFYVANIWGSVVSVNVYEQELYDEVHRQLALQLSIDLNRLWELN